MKLTPLLLAATLAAQAEETNLFQVLPTTGYVHKPFMVMSDKYNPDCCNREALCLLKVETVTNVNLVQPPPMVDSNGCFLAVYQFPIKQTNLTTTYHVGTSDGTELFTVEKGGK